MEARTLSMAYPPVAVPVVSLGVTRPKVAVSKGCI